MRDGKRLPRDFLCAHMMPMYHAGFIIHTQLWSCISLQSLASHQSLTRIRALSDRTAKAEFLHVCDSMFLGPYFYACENFEHFYSWVCVC